MPLLAFHGYSLWCNVTLIKGHGFGLLVHAGLLGGVIYSQESAVFKIPPFCFVIIFCRIRLYFFNDPLSFHSVSFDYRLSNDYNRAKHCYGSFIVTADAEQGIFVVTHKRDIIKFVARLLVVFSDEFSGKAWYNDFLVDYQKCR